MPVTYYSGVIYLLLCTALWALCGKALYKNAFINNNNIIIIITTTTTIHSYITLIHAAKIIKL